MPPLVSVIMSVYNESEQFINEAVNSILNQTMTNLELIIVNDNPDSPQITEFLRKFLSLDERVILLENNKNMGLALSLNSALNQARGMYIARMDADDVSILCRLEKEVTKMEEGYDMVFSSRHNIDEEGNHIEDYIVGVKDELAIKRILPWDCIVTHPSVLYRRDCVENLRGYRNFDVSQDYDLWLRMVTSGYKIGVIEEPLINYRIRRNAISSNKTLLQFETARYIRMLYHERLSQSNDTYTYENYKAYIKSKHALDTNNIRRYRYASTSFYEALQALKDRHYIRGMSKALRSLVGIEWVWYMIYRIMKLKRIEA